MEGVLLIKVEITSMRILMEAKLDKAEWVQNRLDEHNLIEEKRRPRYVMANYISKSSSAHLTRRFIPGCFGKVTSYSKESFQVKETLMESGLLTMKDHLLSRKSSQTEL